MSLFTVPMRLLTAVVLENKSNLVVQELLRLGVLDFIHVETLVPEQASSLLSDRKHDQSVQLADVRNRIEALYRQGGFEIPGPKRLDLAKLSTLNLSDYTRQLDALLDDVQVLREQQKNLSQTAVRYDELAQYCQEGNLDYLDIRVGHAERGDLDTLEARLAPFAHVVLHAESDHQAVVLTLRRDGSQTTPLLDKFGWVESVKVSEQRNALKRLVDALQMKRHELRQEVESVKAAILERIQHDEALLDDMWCNVRMHELIGQIEANFSHTRNTTIFSGWVPAEHSHALESAIRSASGGQCVIEWIDAKSMPRTDIPVAVQEIPALSPFQKMVENYHIPEYGTINPTMFVAITYMAMFGLMFGDAGQGLVIFLLGLFKTLRFKKSADPTGAGKMITANLSKLFMFLGVASMVAGILFGSYFGFPWFEPLWFDYHSAVMGGHNASSVAHDVYWILGLTIKFGIVVIALGLVLNWINLTRKRDWFNLLFDKNGLLGGWMFAIGVWAAFAFVGSGYKSFPDGWFLPVALFVPAIAFLFKVPLKHSVFNIDAHEKKSLGGLLMDSVMEWVVDMLEIFSGFLANTLSFMRVAGLGIAHVSLMAAFAQMAALVGGGVLGVVVMVVGNALVIALEGLSAGIQSLRLNYYEFFSKYYTGKGYAYNPVALHPHAGRQSDRI
jgi:V/A-type H+-transporting ATPase subunit I